MNSKLWFLMDFPVDSFFTPQMIFRTLVSCEPCATHDSECPTDACKMHEMQSEKKSKFN